MQWNRLPDTQPFFFLSLVHSFRSFYSLKLINKCCSVIKSISIETQHTAKENEMNKRKKNALEEESSNSNSKKTTSRTYTIANIFNTINFPRSQTIRYIRCSRRHCIVMVDIFGLLCRLNEDLSIASLFQMIVQLCMVITKWNLYVNRFLFPFFLFYFFVVVVIFIVSNPLQNWWLLLLLLCLCVCAFFFFATTFTFLCSHSIIFVLFPCLFDAITK